jgi:serine/threonine protein kinase
LDDTKPKSEYFAKFNEFDVIAFGCFGVVFKAKNNRQNEMNAIKKIALNKDISDSIMKEFNLMANLDSKYVVEVKSSWIEDNYFITEGFEKFKEKFEDLMISETHPVFKSENNLLLHIQMELCYKTLRDILNQINTELKQNPFEIMTPISYYISCELFIETLECVNYLHKQKIPIIHRDLKPTNILIAFKTKGRFVKLADFGLAKLQESEDQSNSSKTGTPKYMAPEVYTSRRYGTKADVFSLGAIIPELFNFKIDEFCILLIT